MIAASATCPRAGMPWPENAINLEVPEACFSCGAQVLVRLYPAAFKRLEPGKAGEAIVVEGEASCFYHPAKRASVPCATCGRFLCALCDIELNGQHVCPVCLESGKQKGKLSELENKRTLYDSAALSLTILPLLMWPITLLTAPAAVVLAI